MRKVGRLEAAFNQLGRFTADASQLRTAFTIRSVGEVVLQDPKGPAEYSDVIGSLHEEVDRLTRLVQSLLGLSRADAGHVQLERADVSLLALAQEAIALVEVLADEKRQQIGVEGDAKSLVSVDRLILRQAIVNLVDNAIKYSPEDSRILVRVRASDNGYATLEVIDQGPGVPPEHRSHIFDRFYRMDAARVREWGGAGPGLSVALWAVEVHGGQIGVRSEGTRGSTFWIRLPSLGCSDRIQRLGGMQ